MSKHIFTVQRYSILPIYTVGRKRRCYSSLFISFDWQSYGNRHEKALGKDRESDAEAEKHENIFRVIVILVLIRSVRLSFLAVTIDTIDLVAAKIVGDAEREGMGMDVVAGINAVVVV